MISGHLGKLQEETDKAVETHAGGRSNPSTTAEGYGPLVEAKSSKALWIWFAVVVSVLIALWFQTRTPITSYNFFIQGHADELGANVTIDGHPAGTLSQQPDGGVRIIGLRVNLANGPHHVVVTKPGFTSFEADVTLHGEDFLGVNLNRQ